MLNGKLAAMRGVTLIELMIGIAIIALLMVFALPGYQMWIQNTQIRNAAESIQNGLQLARNTAVRDNTSVRFRLTDGSGLTSWSVDADNPSVGGIAYNIEVQKRDGTEASANARAGANNTIGAWGTALAAGQNLPADVIFNGLGRATGVARIDVINSSTSGTRRLVISISPGGLIRMCDPQLSSSVSPQACA